MVRGDRLGLLGVERLPEVERDLLRERAGVREDDGRPIPFEHRAEASEQPTIRESLMGSFVVANQRFNFDRHRRRTLRHGSVNDPAITIGTDQKPRDRLGRATGRRQPQPNRIGSRPGREAFERDREISPAFRRSEGMNLVNDHIPNPSPERIPGALAQKERKTFWSRDQDMRRIIAHFSTLIHRGIAGSHADRDRAFFEAEALPKCLEGQAQVVSKAS